MRVFYSWQSDLPADSNQNFIRKCLEVALANLNAEFQLDVAQRNDSETLPVLRLDHDTKGIPGSPDLVATILEKIRNCDLFIADVSIVGKTNTGTKFIPNPNVMIELGYALHSVGSDRVIQVMDTSYGEPKELPFDLRHKRFPILFESIGGDKNAEERQLIQNFESAIRTFIEFEPLERQAKALLDSPSYSEIISVILSSDSKDDWSSNSVDWQETRFYRNNVELRLQINYDEESGGVQNKDFKEPWANCHPDSHATGYWCDLYYSTTLIKRFLMVSVDGGRALLPIPGSLVNLTVDLLSYKIAKILDSHGTLDSYMNRSGLSVSASQGVLSRI